MTVQDAPGLFADVTPHPISEVLRVTLERNLSLIAGVATEKLRSELIIAPMLVEAREALNRSVGVFSGAEFNVDRERGLFGYCDFLVSRTTTLMAVGAPVLAVVEAKREDLSAGVPQCVAEMYAARLFNERRGSPLGNVNGIVTSGTEWRFLRLDGDTALVDGNDLFIVTPDRILGVLVSMIRSTETPSADNGHNGQSE